MKVFAFFVLVILAAVVAGAYITKDFNKTCGNPEMHISCAPASSPTKARTTTVAPTPTTTKPPVASSTQPAPVTQQPSTSYDPQTGGIVITLPDGQQVTLPATASAVLPGRTSSLPPLPAGPEKMGTLDSIGPIEQCQKGGITVFVDQYLPTTNDLTYVLRSVGSNGSPELTISGTSGHTYPDMRVITSDIDIVGAGHNSPSDYVIPFGAVNRAYDISTPGMALRGVVICL